MSKKKDISKAAAIMGRKGGEAGKGDSKRRTKAQCREGARVRWANWKLRREALESL